MGYSFPEFHLTPFEAFLEFHSPRIQLDLWAYSGVVLRTGKETIYPQSSPYIPSVLGKRRYMSTSPCKACWGCRKTILQLSAVVTSRLLLLKLPTTKKYLKAVRSVSVVRVTSNSMKFILKEFQNCQSFCLIFNL